MWQFSPGMGHGSGVKWVVQRNIKRAMNQCVSFAVGGHSARPGNLRFSLLSDEAEVQIEVQ